MTSLSIGHVPPGKGGGGGGGGGGGLTSSAHLLSKDATITEYFVSLCILTNDKKYAETPASLV